MWGCRGMSTYLVVSDVGKVGRGVGQLNRVREDPDGPDGCAPRVTTWVDWHEDSCPSARGDWLSLLSGLR